MAVIPDEDQAPLPATGEISPETARLVDDEVRRLVDEALDEVRDLLIEHRDALDALAEALLEHETLDTDEAYAAADSRDRPSRPSWARSLPSWAHRTRRPRP